MGNIVPVTVSGELKTRPSLSLASELDRRDSSDDLLHLHKMAALGELASGITHDFRNILQTIISTLELVETRSDKPVEIRRIVASALVASERGIGLSNRLLAFSRCDAPEVTPGPSVPMTMRQPPPASLDLGTGERPRGHAQQQWINQRSEHCWY
jgi:signal transduction histidine kinase